MIKIKFVMPGQDDLFMRDRIIKNFLWKENYDSEIVLTTSNDYDFLVVCNSQTFPPIINKNHIIGVIMEPSWSNNWDRKMDFYAGTIFVHDNNLFKFKNATVIEHPSLMFTEFYNSPEKIDYFLNTDFESYKSEKLNIIISGTKKIGNNLYSQRHTLIHNVLKSGLPINIYGRYLNPDGNRLKGPFEKKLDTVRKAEFSVCVENTSEKNYISEKFFDPLMVDTVPVYYGCPNVSQIYDSECFISFDINNPSSYLDLFDNIIRNYNRYNYLKKIKEMKLNYLKKQNLFSIIVKKIKEINGGKNEN